MLGITLLMMVVAILIIVYAQQYFHVTLHSTGTIVFKTITLGSNVYFGLPACKTYINFATPQILRSAYREDNFWYFNGYGFQVQNANITITNFFVNNELNFTVQAPVGTLSTIIIYIKDKGQPETVIGASDWSYDDATKILIITATHTSSTIRISIVW